MGKAEVEEVAEAFPDGVLSPVLLGCKDVD